MILMNPQAFYCQSIIEQPLKELFPQLFEGAQGWLSLPSELKCTSESFARLNTAAAEGWGGAVASLPMLYSLNCGDFFFSFLDICIEPNALNLFKAADDIQTVNTRSQPFLSDPHFHLIHTYRDAPDYH